MNFLNLNLKIGNWDTNLKYKNIHMDKFRSEALNGLKAGQKDALLGIVDWYRHGKTNSAVLVGAAGTGKTYLMNRLLQYYIHDNVAITAPTHKAVRVISQFTNRQGMTIQSLLGLRPNFNLEDFKLSDVKFDSLGNQKIRNYDLVICDEASQIGQDLLELLNMAMFNFDVKVLFLGDRYQTPPVTRGRQLGNVISPTFNIKPKFKLLEVVRQDKDNHILDLLELLKVDIDTGSETFVKQIKTVKKKFTDKREGYVVADLKPFKEALIKLFQSTGMAENTDLVRLIAYTNKFVDGWNGFIRKYIIKNEDIVDIDDFFVGYKTIVNKFSDTVLINSENYIVGDIDYRKSQFGFWIYGVTLINTHSKKESKLKIVDHLKPFSSYNKILRELHYDAMFAPQMKRADKWRKFFEFKEEYIMLKTITIEYKGKDIFVDKSINYGYSITTHKAQGSTYTTTFIDLVDIMHYGRDKKAKMRDADIRKKLLYTAISRASKNVVLLY